MNNYIFILSTAPAQITNKSDEELDDVKKSIKDLQASLRKDTNSGVVRNKQQQINDDEIVSFFICLFFVIFGCVGGMVMNNCFVIEVTLPKKFLGKKGFCSTHKYS